MAARVHSESARRVSDCVTALLREQPFFGSLALRLPIRADASRETVASDGREIRYSPRWIAEAQAHVIETAMARVVLACALKHHTRRGARDPDRWQHASQLVTHGLLRDAGFTLPPDAEAWDGISVEEAYDRLPEPDPDDGEGDGSAPSGGANAGADSSDTPPSPDAGGSGDSDPQDGDGQDTSADAPPSCDPAGTGEVMDAPASDGNGGEAGPSPADIAAEEQAWDEAMHQAASLAKAQGKLPGAVEETVRGAHGSTVDWRTLLRRYMTDASKSDYSWSLPNRRFIDSGLYLPSIRSEGIDTIAVIVDTSGSLPAGTLAEFWAEVREVASELQPERVILLQVDAAVQHAAEYTASDLPDEIAIRGRGGTDFRPGFAWLEEHDIRPGVCLSPRKCAGARSTRQPAWVWPSGDRGRDDTVQPRRDRLAKPKPAASSRPTRSSDQPFSPKLKRTAGSAMPLPSSAMVTEKRSSPDDRSASVPTAIRTCVASARRLFCKASVMTSESVLA